jgi:nucleoside 2-deoxyribosyltransferase
MDYGKNIYIASGLDNIEEVQELQRQVTGCGWKLTYDWTTHGREFDPTQLALLATAEAYGVQRADLVLVLLPGGRGTHAELGMAIALGKRIVIGAPPGTISKSKPCAFYHHPLVTIIDNWNFTHFIQHL